MTAGPGKTPPTTISAEGRHDTTTSSSVDGDHTSPCATTLVGSNAVEDPYLPAESFLVPVEAELDWVDRNAAAGFDRDDSTKGNTNPKSQAKPPQQQTTTASSQPFSVNLKSLGVHNAGGRKVCRHTNSRNFFPKKKSDVSAASEPGSPNVSCMGRVRSTGSRQSKSAVGFWCCCCGGKRSTHGVECDGGAVPATE